MLSIHKYDNIIWDAFILFCILAIIAALCSSCNQVVENYEYYEPTLCKECGKLILPDTPDTIKDGRNRGYLKSEYKKSGPPDFSDGKSVVIKTSAI